MLRRTLVLGSCLVATFAAVACQEQTTAPLAPRAVPTARPALQQSLLKGLWPDRDALTLPSSVPSVDEVFAEVGSRAINPDDYVCSDVSPITDWLYAELYNTIAVEPNLFFAMYNRYADYVPTYEALFFQTSATPQTYGYNGQFTKAMVKVERDVKNFWDIPSSQIQVLAMHGTVLLDVDRTAAAYRVMGFSNATAIAWAQVDRAALLASTTMNGGNFAFWTFNAVSFRYPGLPDKIVMGDGILEGYAALGFGDVAPQAIFAHEYMHQVQFEKEYFDDLPAGTSDPEQTRYTELMADAGSAYFLTHARGAAMNQKRVAQFLEIFFEIGDCAFTNPGHHGTPNQRMAAAAFGFKLADQAQKQGFILTAEQFHTAFVAEYPNLIAPDAP
jgi:hypothetical protein